MPRVTFIACALGFVSEDLWETLCTQENSGSESVNQMTEETDKSMGGYCFFFFSSLFLQAEIPDTTINSVWPQQN